MLTYGTDVTQAEAEDNRDTLSARLAAEAAVVLTGRLEVWGSVPVNGSCTLIGHGDASLWNVLPPSQWPARHALIAPVVTLDGIEVVIKNLVLGMKAAVSDYIEGSIKETQAAATPVSYRAEIVDRIHDYFRYVEAGETANAEAYRNLALASDAEQTAEIPADPTDDDLRAYRDRYEHVGGRLRLVDVRTDGLFFDAIQGARGASTELNGCTIEGHGHALNGSPGGHLALVNTDLVSHTRHVVYASPGCSIDWQGGSCRMPVHVGKYLLHFFGSSTRVPARDSTITGVAFRNGTIYTSSQRRTDFAGCDFEEGDTAMSFELRHDSRIEDCVFTMWGLSSRSSGPARVDLVRVTHTAEHWVGINPASRVRATVLFIEDSTLGNLYLGDAYCVTVLLRGDVVTQYTQSDWAADSIIRQ